MNHPGGGHGSIVGRGQPAGEPLPPSAAEARECGEPTGKTAACNRPAEEFLPGFWKCPVNHVRPTFPLSQVARTPVTRSGMRARMEDQTGQPDLPTVPDPPTGPAVEPFDYEGSSWKAGEEFAGSEEGRAFWEFLQGEAMDAAVRGEKRYAVKHGMEAFRASRKAEVNNTFAPWFADALILKYPDLEGIVERRKRTKPAPDPVRFLAILEGGA